MTRRRGLSWAALLVTTVCGAAALVVLTNARGRESGDSPPHRVCTLAGCSSLVVALMDDNAYLPEDVTAMELCVGERCTRGQRDHPRMWVSLPKELREEGREIELELRLLDRGGAVIDSSTIARPVHKSAPNGEACGPICFSAGARLRSDGTLAPPRTDLEAPAPHGVDVLTNGQAIRTGPELPAPAGLMLAPLNDIEVRTRRRVAVRISYGERSRYAWDSYRDGGVFRARVAVPRKRLACATDRIVVHLRRRDARQDIAIPSGCAPERP